MAGLAAAAAIVASASASFVPASGSPVAVGDAPDFVATADFDSDGNLDIASANTGSSDVTILLGLGDGTFAEATGSPITVGSSPLGIVAVDFDGDGNPDLAVANSGDDTITILLGAGDGTFTEATGSPIPLAVATAPYGIVAAYLDGDANLDLAVTGVGTDDVTILLGNGDGTFTPEPTESPILVGAGPTGIVAADLNGDSFTDLAITLNAIGQDSVIVLLGDGDGTFTEATGSPVPVGGQPSWLDVGRFDAGPTLDLAVVNSADDTVTILLGNGDGSFLEAIGSPFATGDDPMYVVAADLNDDGDTDLAISNLLGDTLTVLEGDGTGGFSEAAYSPITVGDAPFGMVVADWDSDGLPDLAVANAGDDNLSILLNASSNADLSDLTTTAGPLTPPFDSATTSYTAGPVPFSTTSVTVTPTAANANATIAVRVNGGVFAPVASGSPSGPLPLIVGTNTIDVHVKAQDTTTLKTYTIKVKRLAASSNALLSALTTTAGPLTPPFAPNTTTYTAGPVPFSTSSVTVSATAQQSGAKIQFRVNAGAFSAPASSPATSGPLALNVGANTIQVKVTAENGINARTYTINVTRQPASSNANLSALSTTAGPLSPAFSPATITYTAGPVPNSTTSVTVTATPQQVGATMQVQVNGGGFMPLSSGTPSGPLALNVGPNTIQVKVTAENGTTMKTYTINVTRQAAGGGGGTITGNLTCTTSYTGVTVTGNVTIPAGAGCSFTNSTIKGNVTGSKPLWFTFDQTTIGGNVQIIGVTGLPPATTANSICRSSIGGNLQLVSSATAVSIGDNPPCLGGNTIKGNAQVVSNKALVRISSNSITGILQCSSNVPAPTGSGNTAAMKSGQCASL